MPAGPESPDSKKPARPVPAGRPLDPFAIGRSILGPTRTPTPPEVEGFEIEGFVAEGGLGQVWRARHRETNALVALKIPHRADPEVAERLVVEAATLGVLRHPHIVGFQGVAETSDGQPVLIMDLVVGATLAARLPEGGFDFEHALQILFPVLEAVEHAHASGIIHRDLKPTNILLADDGGIVVSDFGLARSPRERALAFSLTQSGAVAGTVEYLAPECYRPGYVPTVAADIFALGILLYELLSGAPPRGAWKPLSEIKRIDVRLDELLREAIDPDPARRPATVREFRQRLEEIRVAKPRMAGSPLVNRATRAADFAWTCAGLYFCVAGFCTVLAMTRTPVPAMFNLTYGVPGLLIGGWLGVWTLALGMGVLWLWQIVRLRLFRHTPMREALPSPFGARLGTSTTAAVQVGIIQFLCAWMPVIYALNIMGLSFHWRGRDTPMWQEGLVVTPWLTDEPVSPWRWHPIKSFDGGAYWLKQAKGSYIPGTLKVTDKTSFFIFVQPAAMVTAAIIICIGMAATFVRWTASWWKNRRALWMVTTLATVVGCVVLGLTVAHDMDMKKVLAGRTKTEIEKLESLAIIEEYQERFDTAFRTFIAHDPEEIKKGHRPADFFSKSFRWDIPGWQGPPSVQSSPFNWIKIDRKVAAAQNRVLLGDSAGGGRLRTNRQNRKRLGYDWRYVQFTDPPGGPATADYLRIHLAGRWQRGEPIFVDYGIQYFDRLYTADNVLLQAPEALKFIDDFLAVLAEPSAPRLDEWAADKLVTDSGRLAGRAVISAWRAERAKWDSFTLRVSAPLPDPQRMPGGRWRLQPRVSLQGTLKGKSSPEPRTMLHFTIDIAHIDGRFRVVGNWLADVLSDGTGSNAEQPELTDNQAN